MDNNATIIPKNAFKGKRILGMKSKNFKEGVILAILFSLLMFQIPFVPKVRWIIIVCFGVAIVLLSGIGLRGLAPSQIVKYYFSYRRKVKQISYRRFTKDAKRSEPIIDAKGNVRKVKNAPTGLKRFIR